MPTRLDRPAATATALGVLFTLLTTAITWAEHETFNSTSLDLATYTQVVWNTAAGRPFETTLLLQNRLHVAEHLALLLLPLAPLSGLLADVKLLLLLQQSALALAGLPLYWVARSRLGPWRGLLVLGGYYLMPTLGEVAFDAFYPIALAALPIGAAAALALADRPRAALLLAASGVLIEEEAALAAVGVGMYLLAFGQSGRRAGLASLLIGGVWLGLSEMVVMPGFLHPIGGDASRPELHFGGLRQDPLGWLGRVAVERLEPELVRVSGLAPRLGQPPPCQQPGQCSALRWWLYPTGGLALLSPSTLVMAAPTGAALLLADRPGRFRRHWAAPMLPIIWLATAVGLARLSRAPLPRRLAAAALVGASLVTFRLDASLPFGGQFEPDDIVPHVAAADLRRLGRAVAADASLGASRRGLAHWANRRALYAFPPDDYAAGLWPPPSPPDFYLLDLGNADTIRELEGPASPVRGSPRYREVERTPNALLLDRAGR